MRKLCYMLFFLIIATNLHSQFTSKKVYGLREVLQIALENNYDLRLGSASVEFSEVDMKNAFGQYLPNISLSSSYSRQLNNPNEIRDELLNQYSARLGANLVLFDGFGREANYTRAQKTMKSAVTNIDFLKQTVFLDAYNAYINVVRAYQIVRAHRENLSLGEAELSRIRARYEAGVLPATAVYAQEADLGNRTLELITAENELNIAKAQLLTIMGMPPTMDVKFRIDDLPSALPEAEIRAFRDEIGNINNAVNIALNNRLDWKSSKLRLEATQENLEIAKSYYYPQISANSYWSWMNTSLKGFDRSNYYFGLSLSVPIFNNFSTDLRVQSSKLELTRISVELQKLEQQILSSVQIAFLNLQTAEKQIDIANKTVLSAQENYQSTQERLNVGAATTNDLIQANTQLISSQINKINAIYNYIKAKNDLKYSIGTLSFE